MLERGGTGVETDGVSAALLVGKGADGGCSGWVSVLLDFWGQARLLERFRGVVSCDAEASSL